MSPISKFMVRALPAPEPDPTPVVARKSYTELVALAAEGKLDEYLAQHGVPDFKEDDDEPKVRKFGSRPAFDRATFDLEAYTASIEKEYKTN